MFYDVGMSKTITSSQMLGEIREAAARLRFLRIGFQFDGRSRLEAGIDGIAEVMDDRKPLARMIAVLVKTTESETYTSEDDERFYSQEVPSGVTEGDRRLEHAMIGARYRSPSLKVLVSKFGVQTRSRD